MAESAQHDAQERTEAATPRRLDEARRQGNVVRSRELATTVLLLGGAVGLLVLGPALVDALAALARASFTHAAVHRTHEIELWPAFRAALVHGLLAVAPLLALSAAAGIGGSLAIGGWTFSAEALAPKWDKLDPVRGFGRVFSLRGVMELAKAFVKFVVVTAGAVELLWIARDQYLALGTEALRPGLAHAVWLIAVGFLALAATTVLVALADVPFQLWNHGRQLRMSRQELKDEMKETEGRPEVKGRIRQLQREIATRRMMEAVPKADVVVTNPSHYAVALRYDADSMRAPRLVAKGADLVAARIRAVAAEHGVPLLRSPGLARAIHYSTRIDHEIPVGLYRAVAQVLAYVYRLRGTSRGPELPPMPEEPPIPSELRVDP